MTREGKTVLFLFPYADHKEGKLRPALVIRRLPGAYEDWLICMISSQLSQEVSSLDEIISNYDQFCPHEMEKRLFYETSVWKNGSMF